MRSFFAQQHHMTICKIYNGQLVFLTRILTPLVHPSAKRLFYVMLGLANDENLPPPLTEHLIMSNRL